jgi:hypothetical protein
MQKFAEVASIIDCDTGTIRRSIGSHSARQPSKDGSLQISKSFAQTRSKITAAFQVK